MRRFLFALLASQAAFAQVADVPAIRAGDRWRFVEYYSVPSREPNRDWVVTSVTADEIRGTENGAPLLLTRDLNTVDSPRNHYSNPRWMQFPLAVGKRWEFSTDWTLKATGSRGRAEVGVEVVAYETVKVVAGDYAAFKLVAKSRLAGTSPKGSTYDGSIVTTTYWYAPAARNVVRWEVHNPYVGRSTVELVVMDAAP